MGAAAVRFFLFPDGLALALPLFLAAPERAPGTDPGVRFAMPGPFGVGASESLQVHPQRTKVAVRQAMRSINLPTCSARLSVSSASSHQHVGSSRDSYGLFWTGGAWVGIVVE